MEKTRTPDGAGGYIVAWAEGAEFFNYQALDTSLEARRAEKERVTSNPEERAAPRSPGPTIRALKFFTAERKELPT